MRFPAIASMLIRMIKTGFPFFDSFWAAADRNAGNMVAASMGMGLEFQRMTTAHIKKASGVAEIESDYLAREAKRREGTGQEMPSSDFCPERAAG